MCYKFFFFTINKIYPEIVENNCKIFQIDFKYILLFKILKINSIMNNKLQDNSQKSIILFMTIFFSEVCL